MRELRYVLRALNRTRWYTGTIVGVLAIGIAVATVVFAVVDGVLFKPLPYPRIGELFLVRADVSRGSGPLTTALDQPPFVSGIEVEAWADAVREVTLTTMAAPHRFARTATRDYWAAEVDEQFLDTLGVRPAIGGFTADDYGWAERTDGTRMMPVLVSHRYWQRELGGDPAVAGRVLDESERNGQRWGERVAGVLPRDFVFPVDPEDPQPEILLPMRRARGPSERDTLALVRIPPSADLASIRERLLAATGRAALVVPPHGRREAAFDTVRLVSVADQLGRHERRAFAMVASGAAVLLLLACINVAGLAAARNVERQRDLAVRRSLGATTSVVVRDVLLEVGVIGVVAAVVGVVLATPLLQWTVLLLPDTVVLLKTPQIDGRVLTAVAALAIGTAVLVALWPAMVAARVGASLAPARAAVTASPVGRRSRAMLIGSQVALGFVLLTVGALTTASLAAAWLTDAGYVRDRMILVEAYIRSYASGADATRQLEEIDDLLARIPGVERVATSSIQPLFSSSSMRAFTTLVPDGWQGGSQAASMRRVSDGFFDVMGIRLVDGRWAVRGEWSVEQPVAMVSESAARTLWPGRSAIGQTLVAAGRATEPSRTVIGVVADARFVALDRDPLGEIYVPDRFMPGRTGAFFHLRTSGDAAAIVPLVSRTLRERQIFTNQVVTHQDALFASVRHRALPAWLFGGLGTAALLLAGVGILGLLAMSAAQRTREIGIRIALGATGARVVALMIREQSSAVALGLLAGAGVSVWAARLAESQLYRVRAYDPVVWTTVALALLAVAGLGTLVPSLRAARINPVEALRAE